MERRSPTFEKRKLAISLIRSRLSAGFSLGRAMGFAQKIIGESENGHCPSRATLYRWYRRFEAGGWSALETTRKASDSTVLSEVFLEFLRDEKLRDPKASVPEVIRRAVEDGVVPENHNLDRTTVYRHAARLNLPLMRTKGPQNNARPFAYPHRMTMVLCDGKWFRAGPQSLKRLAFFFIDDATRYVLDVIVGFSENSHLFLRGLYDVIQAHGLMETLYLDHGSAFIANDLFRVAAPLGITPIHGKVRYPEGHGKIERFHRTAQDQCLKGLASPAVNPSPAMLRERIRHYIRGQYAHTVHESLEGLTPHQRFTSDPRKLKFPRNSEQLNSAFKLAEDRKVRNDNVISLHGNLYEVPLGLAGTHITVYWDVLTHDVSMLHLGKAMKLHSPDLHSNAREKRNSPEKPEKIPRSAPVTATERSWRKKTRTIVDEDGGFT